MASSDQPFSTGPQTLGPTGPANVDERIAAIAPRVDAAPETVAQAPRTPAEEDRAWIARRIIWIFVATIASVMFLLLIQGIATGKWETVATQAAELIKTAVLPIVTLVLGYYFGQAGKG